jgi:hypothetical protein
MKIHSKEVKSKKKINIVKILIYLLFFFVIGTLGYYLFSILTIKFTDPVKGDSSHQYLFSQNTDDTQKTLIVLEGGTQNDRKISGAYLFLTNKQKEESVLIYLPSWMYFGGLEQDFGNSIPVSSFEYAGNFLQQGSGVEYAVWQISQMLAIKVDNYIWFTPNGVTNFTNMFGDISNVNSDDKQYYKAQNSDILSDAFFKLDTMSSKYSTLKTIYNIKQLYDFKDSVYTNLNFSGFLNFFATFENSVKNTETNGIDLSSYNYSTEGTSTSGEQIRYINTDEFDTVYRTLVSKVIDRSLEAERARVEVYNGSSVAGAAQQFGRKIENAGCDVIRYENAPSTIDKTVVYVTNKDSFSNSLKVVSEILSGNYTLVEGRPSFVTTGDIVVVLGQDVKDMYNF